MRHTVGEFLVPNYRTIEGDGKTWVLEGLICL